MRTRECVFFLYSNRIRIQPNTDSKSSRTTRELAKEHLKVLRPSCGSFFLCGSKKRNNKRGLKCKLKANYAFLSSGSLVFAFLIFWNTKSPLVLTNTPVVTLVGHPLPHCSKSRKMVWSPFTVIVGGIIYIWGIRWKGIISNVY